MTQKQKKGVCVCVAFFCFHTRSFMSHILFVLQSLGGHLSGVECICGLQTRTQRPLSGSTSLFLPLWVWQAYFSFSVSFSPSAPLSDSFSLPPHTLVLTLHFLGLSGKISLVFPQKTITRKQKHLQPDICFQRPFDFFLTTNWAITHTCTPPEKGEITCKCPTMTCYYQSAASVLSSTVLYMVSKMWDLHIPRKTYDTSLPSFLIMTSNTSCWSTCGYFL